MSKHRSLGIKLGMVAHTCHPSTWEVEAGGSEVQGHPWTHYEGAAQGADNCICRVQNQEFMRMPKDSMVTHS